MLLKLIHNVQSAFLKCTLQRICSQTSVVYGSGPQRRANMHMKVLVALSYICMYVSMYVFPVNFRRSTAAPLSFLFFYTARGNHRNVHVRNLAMYVCVRWNPLCDGCNMVVKNIAVVPVSCWVHKFSKV